MGTLFIVATPIGNLGDITVRAIEILFTADVIACEDTRRTGLLLQQLSQKYSGCIPQITQRNPVYVRYDNFTEMNSATKLLTLLESGTSVALVTDAGTPLISDPGFILVREARKRGITITAVPGASAVHAALSTSGLPVTPYIFFGFPPDKQGPRRKQIESARSLTETRTLVWYCSPHKLTSMFDDILDIFGDVSITLSRELTKVHEEIWTGSVSDARIYFREPKGEFVLMMRLPEQA